MVFCGECGAQLPNDATFCEKCGAKIKAAGPKNASAASANAATVKPPTKSTGGLFDPSRDVYVLKEKWFDWGGGDIMDAQGNKIGKMHRKVLSLRAAIEFQELDGTISASINRKLIAIKPTYDLHAADDSLLARLSKTLFSLLRPKIELKDENGNVILTAQGKFMGFDFQVYKGKDEKAVVAEIRKADRWRDVFLQGLMDFSDTYALKINDPSLDRRIALGFVVAIDNMLHDQK